MANQKLQEFLIETNGRSTNIMNIHLTQNRHMINGLADALKV